MPLLGGLTLGVGILMKENAIFFAPAVVYLLYRYVRPRRSFRFGLGFWCYMVCAVVSVYFLYALLKNELLPSHLNFDLNNPPADHVSLLYTLWWQLHRSQGSILDTHSLVYQLSLGTWLPKDAFLLIGGALATAVTLVMGIRERKTNPGILTAAVLSASYAFYVFHGSVILQFYVVPLLPFFAMTIGILGARILDGFVGAPSLRRRSAVAQTAILATCFAVLLLPSGGYFFVRDTSGNVVAHDLYKLPQTFMENEQVAFVRANIPPDARIVMDDDLWVALHGVQPTYPYAHSHWKASSDPAVRDQVFHQDWQNVDYIVMSNQMLQAMQQNGPGEDYILEALSHATRIWDLQRGNVELSVYQVQK